MCELLLRLFIVRMRQMVPQWHSHFSGLSSVGAGFGWWPSSRWCSTIPLAALKQDSRKSALRQGRRSC
jgi:hypothetical protein